ncbi:MAG: hypothetical protein RJP95_04170 [Pirellulales bacterium]
MATDMIEEQAGQNRAMAELNSDVALATRRIAEEQAKSRQAYAETQKQLQGERVDLNRQWEHLEDERRQIAREKHRDPIIAAAILQLGMIAACLSPLILCWALLNRGPPAHSEVELNEWLVEELAGEETRLLGRPTKQPPAIADRWETEHPDFPDEFDDA